MEDNINILVVDDSPSWCAIYEEALSESAYAVHIASDMTSALDCLNQQFFHVAIVDIRLDPDDRDNVEGLDVLQRIWELDEGTVAIVSSAHATADMLPSFRAYSVFDFVAKRELSPDDLARQYKSAAFIKGTIDKSGSLTESLARIDQAVLEARRISNNRKWLESPFHLFRGLSSRHMQADLGGAGLVELRPFLGRLCRPLFPWLHGSRNVVSILDDSGKTMAVEGYVWSRALGKPVIARVGRREHFEESVSQAPVGASWDGAETGEAILRQSSPHFEGLVCLVTDKSFDANFNPPPPRRTSKSSHA